MAETDRFGNVNVSRFGARLAGASGFINISQNARRLVFAGTFIAGGLDIAIDGERVRIVTEGRKHKFVERVEHHLQRRTGCCNRAIGHCLEL
jgi:propionate CoA-transferase